MEFDWHTLLDGLSYAGLALLCLLGFVLSCLSISGTWMVLLASGLLCWMRWPEFPGPITLAILLVMCILVEVLEAIASSWGVQKRGGSKAAGWGALIGSFLGMLLGGLIPIPVLGSLIGMMAGSFAGAFVIEQARMRKTEQAAHIAFGAVMARIAVIFLKAGITLGMIIVLTAGLLL